MVSSVAVKVLLLLAPLASMGQYFCGFETVAGVVGDGAKRAPLR